MSIHEIQVLISILGAILACGGAVIGVKYGLNGMRLAQKEMKEDIHEIRDTIEKEREYRVKDGRRLAVVEDKVMQMPCVADPKGYWTQINETR